MLLSLLFACAAKVEGSDDTADVDTDTDTDADTDTDTDTDTEQTRGKVYDETDAAFSMVFDGSSWEAVDGYWIVLDDEASIRASIDTGKGTTQITILTIDGDISWAGTYPVTEVQWVEQVNSSGDSFHYEISGPNSLTFTTLGFAGEDDLFGTVDGEVQLTDNVGGGSVTAAGGALAGWPHY